MASKEAARIDALYDAMDTNRDGQVSKTEVDPADLEFMSKLDAFYAMKVGIELVKASAAEPGELETCDMEVDRIMDESTGKLNLKHYQRTLDGKRPIRSTDNLYNVAERVLPAFTKMMNEIMAEAGEGVEAVVATLKLKERAEKKATNDYGTRECDGGGPPIGWVFDIVRGKFVCKSGTSMKKVVALLEKDPRIKATLNFKNRFRNPTANGYGDYLLHVVFQAGILVHVCEIQVHLRAVTEYADTHGSHESYKYFRRFFAGSMNTVVARLADMQIVVGDDYVPAHEGTSGAGVLERIVNIVVESRDTGRMDEFFTLCLDYLQMYDLAMYLMEAKLVLTVETKGEHHVDVGAVYNDMGSVLDNQLKYDLALDYYKRSLAIRIKLLGIDHEKVGGTYNNMGNVLSSQHKYDEAMVCYQKDFVITVKVFGKDHIYASHSYNNMALVLEDQYKFDEAMECHRNALAIRVAAKDDENIGVSYNNMGGLLESQGKYDEARDLFQKSIALRVKVLGEDHSDLSGSYGGLADVLKSQGKYDEAMDYQRKALAINIAACGESHSYVGSTYTSMGKILQPQLKYDEAMTCFQKALGILDQDDDEDSVADTYNGIANVHSGQGDYESAMSFYQKALAIRLKLSSDPNVDVGETYLGLAQLAKKQNHFAKAFDLYTKAVNMFKLTLGPDHHKTRDAIMHADQVRGTMAKDQGAMGRGAI